MRNRSKKLNVSKEFDDFIRNIRLEMVINGRPMTIQGITTEIARNGGGLKMRKKKRRAIC